MMTNELSGFYITLPSNTPGFNLDGKMNNISSFNVNLPKDIDLEGKDVVIALSEIIYTNSIENKESGMYFELHPGPYLVSNEGLEGEAIAEINVETKASDEGMISSKRRKRKTETLGDHKRKKWFEMINHFGFNISPEKYETEWKSTLLVPDVLSIDHASYTNIQDLLRGMNSKMSYSKWLLLKLMSSKRWYPALQWEV